jgi:hypothetical protein
MHILQADQTWEMKANLDGPERMFSTFAEPLRTGLGLVGVRELSRTCFQGSGLELGEPHTDVRRYA